MKTINWNKISKNPEVINLLRKMINIQYSIKQIDNMALINYELELLNLENDLIK